MFCNFCLVFAWLVGFNERTTNLSLLNWLKAAGIGADRQNLHFRGFLFGGILVTKSVALI
jgi:hypothetical protein